MKSVKPAVRDFKSVRNSTATEVGDVTCLAGKNESGKTAILQALDNLNPVVPEHGTFDVTDEYPCAEVEEYLQQVESEGISPAVVVQAEYALEPAEVKAVGGEGALLKAAISLLKRYDNKLYVDLRVNEAVAVKVLVKIHELTEKVARGASACE